MLTCFKILSKQESRNNKGKIKRNIKGVIVLLVIVGFLAAVFSACFRESRILQQSFPRFLQQDSNLFTSYRDIPGLMKNEIDAIEALKTEYDYFVFGMHPTTEIFVTNGEVKGYAVLLCDWLTELFGLTFVPRIYDWSDLISGLESHTIDFTATLSSTEERRRTYIMTDAIVWHTISYFTLTDSKPLAEILTSRVPRYAFLDGTIIYGEVFPFISYPFEAVFISDYDTAYKMLSNGEIDAFFDKNTAEGSFEDSANIKNHDFYPLIYIPMSLATQNPVFEPIISVVQKALHAGAVQSLVELYVKGHHDYLYYTLQSRLTDEEKRYISENPVIKVAMETSNYPISFFNEREKEWQGIAIDILNEIGRFTGLRFENANNIDAAFADLLRLTENGEAAILTEVFRTPERERQFLLPNISYMTVYPALISTLDHRNITLNEILFMRIGLIENYSQTTLFNQWFPNHYYTKYFDSNLAAFNALDRGELDMVMTSSHDLLILTHYLERPGYKLNFIFNYNFESTFGINQNEAVLHSIINKSLDILDTKMISEQWVLRTFDYRANILEAQLPWIYGTGALLLLLLIVLLLLIIFFYRKTVLEKAAHKAELAKGHAEAVADAMRAGIEYAGTIQANMLPPDSEMAKLFSDYSVIWMPRDDVGGDIYWMKNFDNGAVFCACDCTGHGTPGALLTMLVVSAFESVISQQNCHDTARTVWELEKRLYKVFNVSGRNKEDLKDGCDLAVMFIAKDGNITVSAANTDIFICDGKEVTRYRGQRIFIGEGNINSKNDIKTVFIPANPDNKYYIASDGLYDQPSPQRRGSFGYKLFKELILTHHNEKLSVISEKVWEAFEAHRDGFKRVDDFQLITFKL
ncbi:MAG: transporter substrate-binding domain-containing protein [Treponema sp.]|nr:transporter substrate-binding domain-containing protein [Treponema sp.]